LQVNHIVIMSKSIELILFKILIRGAIFLVLVLSLPLFKFLIVFFSFCVCLLEGGLDVHQGLFIVLKLGQQV